MRAEEGGKAAKRWGKEKKERKGKKKREKVAGSPLGSPALGKRREKADFSPQLGLRRASSPPPPLPRAALPAKSVIRGRK